MQGLNLRPLPCESISANLQHPTPTQHELTEVRIYQYCLMLVGVGWNELERTDVVYKMNTVT